MGELNLDELERQAEERSRVGPVGMTVVADVVLTLIARIRELERMNALAYQNGFSDGRKFEDQYAKGWNDARRATDGQRAGVLEGWKLVPVEPTHDMLVALSGEWHSSRNAPYRAKYKAMLAAAPTPPDGDAGQKSSTDPYAEGYEDALAHAAFYVRDHCAEGEYHADVIEKLKRPARAAIAASKGGTP